MTLQEREKAISTITKEFDKLDPIKQKVVELFITCLQASESLDNSKIA